jgi:hypothetical protein
MKRLPAFLCRQRNDRRRQKYRDLRLVAAVVRVFCLRSSEDRNEILALAKLADRPGADRNEINEALETMADLICQDA